MEVVAQLMMGFGLAACAGLRAWLPMLAAGLMARGGYVELHTSFDFLSRTDALIVFGVATALELLGDKIIAIDHFLDAAGTVLRPAAGTLLTASFLTSLDPLAALVLGLIVGGTTSFTVHAGKAIVRAKTSALAFAHGGAGNAIVSTVEDIISVIGLWIVAHAPLIAFVLALVFVIFSAWLVVKFVKTGRRLFAFLRNRRQGRSRATPQSASAH